jgi:hypothetical protein
MIDAISECLPRIRIYEKLKSHPTLQTALRDLYISVIEFSTLALKYFNRNAFCTCSQLSNSATTLTQKMDSSCDPPN